MGRRRSFVNKGSGAKHRFKMVIVGSYAPSLINFRGPLIASMVAKGWDVTAVAPDIEQKTEAALRQLGANVVSIPLRRTSINAAGDLIFYWRLKRLFRTLRPDAFLGYTAKPVIWGTLAAKSAEVRTAIAMITGLGYVFTDGTARSTKRNLARMAASTLYRFALRKADHVLFQNQDDLALFHHAGLVDELKTSVINGSGVDLEHFSLAPQPAKVSFLMIARLLQAKGVRDYASAAIALKARHPDIRFRLAGWIDEGPDAISSAELESWTARGLDFLGHLDDVRPSIAEAAVYVLPSWREGTPRTVLEAMAMGRAIITTDAPGCRETVADGQNGFLVPVRNPDALAAVMERFIIDPALAKQMGDASRGLACAKYDVHAINAEIICTVDRGRKT
jgi:glycosyltransferase involved in cell wall biosynthesis